jgi:hypothetical protein
MPEFVATQDGAEKQDCKRNAVKRWFDSHHPRIAPLRPIYLGDDVFACHPICEDGDGRRRRFHLHCKPSSHKALYEFIDGAEAFRHEERVRRRNTKETFATDFLPFRQEGCIERGALARIKACYRRPRDSAP